MIVESEDQPERLLLETKIIKDDGFQKQQGTSHGSRVLYDLSPFVLTTPHRYPHSLDGEWS